MRASFSDCAEVNLTDSIFADNIFVYQPILPETHVVQRQNNHSIFFHWFNISYQIHEKKFVNKINYRFKNFMCCSLIDKIQFLIKVRKCILAEFDFNFFRNLHNMFLLKYIFLIKVEVFTRNVS